MHASYLIVHSPTICAVHVDTWMAVLLEEAVVMLAMVSGAREKMDGECEMHM